MLANSRGTIFITGASSGIGRACAIILAQRGFNVFAGIVENTDVEEVFGKNPNNITPIIVDITNKEMIDEAYDLIVKKTNGKGLDGLLNNAGIAFGAPIECIPIEYIKKMFDVDVFGHIAVIQRFLPLIRKAHGRIINISSICSGPQSLPFLSTYSAAKTALESFSDTLRMELRPWKIPVVIIDPGSIDTAMYQEISDKTTELFEHFSIEGQQLYKSSMTAYLKATNGFKQHSISPEVVAKKIERIFVAKHLRTRYTIGEDAFLGYHIIRHLPDFIRDLVLTKFIIKLPKKGSMLT